MARKPTTTQAMPHDGRKGAPDGVNNQGEVDKLRLKREGVKNGGKHGVGGGFMDHGGQSMMGYHGARQLAEDEVEPDGNNNDGAKK
jgi:hypothetical protein